MRALPLLLSATLSLAPSALAGEGLHDPDELVEIVLTEPGGFQDIHVRVATPGLLAFETDSETARKVTVEVLDLQGRVVGKGGARILRGGEYLIRLRRHRDFAGERGFARWDGKGEGVLALWSPDPDIFEPNDSPAAGAVLALDDDHPVAGGPVSLFPSDDEDHFTLRLARPGFVTSVISIPAIIDPSIDFWFEDSADRGKWPSGETRLVPQGDLRLVLRSSAPHPVPVEIGFEFVPNWDACEPNDRPEEACDLSGGETIPVSLFPARDVDWFSVLTDRPGAIALSLTGLPPTEYDQNGRVVRGLDLRIQFGSTPAGRGGQSHITHGTVFIGAPVAGEYNFALSGRWIDANPVRSFGVKASFVDPTAGPPDPSFSILGVYGSGADDNSALELTVLAGLGSGRFYSATNVREIETAVRHFIGLPQASEESQEPADPPDERGAAPARQDQDGPALDPRLQGKNPKLQAALRKKREAARERKSQASLEKTPDSTEPATQTANLPELSPEEEELRRLRLFEEWLGASPEETLWRHHYEDENGAVVKRLEAAEKAELADRWKLLESKRLTPRIARRLLSRAIQRLE